MICRIPLYLITLCFVSVLGAGEPPANDNCMSQIKPELRNLLLKKFPGFRLPIGTDNLEEDIQINIKEGGNGCLGIAKGDFNGDGRIDFAIALTQDSGPGWIVIAALKQSKGWSIEVIVRNPEGRNRLYLETIKPGKYANMYPKSSDVEYRKGEMENFTARYPGIIVGRTEAASVAYFRSKQGWVSLQLSD